MLRTFGIGLIVCSGAFSQSMSTEPEDRPFQEEMEELRKTEEGQRQLEEKAMSSLRITSSRLGWCYVTIDGELLFPREGAYPEEDILIFSPGKDADTLDIRYAEGLDYFDVAHIDDDGAVHMIVHKTGSEIPHLPPLSLPQRWPFDTGPTSTAEIPPRTLISKHGLEKRHEVERPSDAIGWFWIDWRQQLHAASEEDPYTETIYWVARMGEDLVVFSTDGDGKRTSLATVAASNLQIHWAPEFYDNTGVVPEEADYWPFISRDGQLNVLPGSVIYAGQRNLTDPLLFTDGTYCTISCICTVQDWVAYGYCPSDPTMLHKYMRSEKR